MIAKYNAKYIPAQMDAQREAVKAMAVANFTTYANEWESKASATRDVLNAAGVASSAYFGYFAFSNEMFHVWKHFSGQAAEAEAAVLVAKYVALGLVLATLESIRTTVYNIAAAA
jgi:hypothetical protein